MKILITGGCGFVGSNLSIEALNRGYELHILDNLSRHGSDLNLSYLKDLGEFVFHKTDVTNQLEIDRIVKSIKPDAIFHLAGQVAMTTSISSPRLDFNTNVVGTINLLESVRHYSPDSVIIYSSSNKVYGDFDHLNFEEGETRYFAPEYPEGFNESLPLNFQSPYGCSKGAADQYLLDYYRIYGIKTTVFRHSSMFGGLQHPSYDQGWIGWFCKKALESKFSIEPELFSISGNGKQVRDVLHAKDVVSLYFKAFSSIEKCKGEAFNVGGGPENSLSLLELFSFLNKELGIQLKYEILPFRKSDQLVFVANNNKVTSLTGWKPNILKESGIRSTLNWMKEIYFE